MIRFCIFGTLGDIGRVLEDYYVGRPQSFHASIERFWSQQPLIPYICEKYVYYAAQGLHYTDILVMLY